MASKPAGHAAVSLLMLSIDPASTRHRQFDEAQLRAAGVLPDMIDISVGLEHIDNFLWDIDEVLVIANA